MSPIERSNCQSINSKVVCNVVPWMHNDERVIDRDSQ